MSGGNAAGALAKPLIPRFCRSSGFHLALTAPLLY